MMPVTRKLYLSLILVFISSVAFSQQMHIDETKIIKQFPQVSLVFNRIFNSSALDSFYFKLQQLKKNKKGKVTIVHIGDSHLRSDDLTGTVRKGFQEFFGSAGKSSNYSKSISILTNDNKDSNGVYYHSMGTNGARYESYNQSATVWPQVASLEPDLFIISLGTNDAQANTITDAELHKQVTSLVDKVKKAAPGCAILITTTADSFKRGASNRELWNLNLSLFSYCTNNNIPVWDMYRVTNGFGSAINWMRRGLMNGDGIHFTSNAYKIQGQLLYNALAKGYNSFVSNY